jgi:hypothetical protein
MIELPPLHNTGVEEIEAVNAVGCVIEILVEAEQPLASVIVYEYVPATTLYDPVPVYGPVPPEPATTTVAVPPKQLIPAELELAVNAVGSVTVILVVAVHPLASVTV